MKKVPSCVQPRENEPHLQMNARVDYLSFDISLEENEAVFPTCFFGTRVFLFGGFIHPTRVQRDTVPDI